MKTALLVLCLTLAAAYSSVVQINGEKKAADADFLKRQKQVLELYLGAAHTEHFHNEYSDFDFIAHSDHFHDPLVVKKFVEAYKHGFLPKDAVFTLNCYHTRHDAIKLFDVFFFAKDFETFYKAASWAKKHVHPMMFVYTYSLALVHREDCQDFVLPPLYEVFPNYFIPQDVLHKLYDDKLLGIEEKKYEYNNTGYEYNYHSGMFGGPLSEDAYAPHLDYKVSYFREDVGANTFYSMWHLKNPSWMCPEKYKIGHFFKRGENFYYTHQQIFARYNLERIANGLPYVEPLYWEKPIKTGYNPRISHFNGVPFYTRPDNIVPKYMNKYTVHKAQAYEQRIYEAIDEGSFWDNKSMIHINNDDGVDYLGKMVHGTVDFPSKNYFGSWFYTARNAIAHVVKTSNDHSYVGGALSSAMTTLRDPVFYSFLNRFTRLFQWHKKNFHPYTHEELGFPGVSVKNFDVDNLVTYFDHFDYEITNALPFKGVEEYNKYKFYATQYRLNHKPFNYKITVESDKQYEGIVRIFIGPKYDSEEHLLSLEQSRMMMYEIDRFPVKIDAGENVFTRNSRESPVFVGDYEGFRHIYNRVENALKNKEAFYIEKKVNCGVPHRFQIPVGTEAGHPYTFYVVVSPFEKKYDQDAKGFHPTCGSSKLYDYRPLGFPFDRHIRDFNVPNIYYKDVLIYHKNEKDINRAE